MQFTKNYKLKKPELNEYALVTDLNENADVIDGELLKIGNSQAEVKQQFTTHLADMAKHNQFMDGTTKKQLVLGVNQTLNCLTVDIVEVTA